MHAPPASTHDAPLPMGNSTVREANPSVVSTNEAVGSQYPAKYELDRRACSDSHPVARIERENMPAPPGAPKVAGPQPTSMKPAKEEACPPRVAASRARAHVCPPSDVSHASRSTQLE